MRCSRTRTILLLAGAVLVASHHAEAQEAPAVRPPVRVEVMVGYASSMKGEIDPRALELSKMLGREFNLQTLRVIQLQQLSLALRQMGQVELPTGHWVSVQPEEFTARGLRMGVEVQGMLRTHVNVPSGNQVVIGAYTYEDGRLLVRLAPIYDMPDGMLLPSMGPPDDIRPPQGR